MFDFQCCIVIPSVVVTVVLHLVCSLVYIVQFAGYHIAGSMMDYRNAHCSNWPQKGTQHLEGEAAKKYLQL